MDVHCWSNHDNKLKMIKLSQPILSCLICSIKVFNPLCCCCYLNIDIKDYN